MSDEYDPDDSSYSLEDVCDRLDNIEAAVTANHWDLRWVGLVIFVWLALAGFADMWNSKLRYSWWYNVSYDQVTIQKESTECNFFHAPMGGKDCHYDREVSTIRVKTEASVNFVSFDEGKTWTVDDANPLTKPHVIVSWERIEE
jgi:hypothetical protein